MDVERDGYVDWKGKSVTPAKNRGIAGATIVCLVEVLENMVFISNASNLVTYFHSFMHYSLVRSANMLTNYMGTSFLLSLFGGFVSDTFLSRFSTLVLFGLVELTGLVMLTIQAHYEWLRPGQGKEPSPSQATVLYVGLYAVAIGVGGVKASLPAHGADQLDHSNQRLVSTFFNWFFFCLCSGGMLAVTIVVWVQDNVGWKWGFGISAIALSLGLTIFGAGLPLYRHKNPIGSPITRIIKVLVSSVKNWKHSWPEVNVNASGGKTKSRFRFLNKALVRDGINESEVEETRTFLSLLPIFASTIMMNCCLAQLMTFSVQQGRAMDRTLSNGLKISPASLIGVPLTVMLISVPFYDRVILVLVRKFLHKEAAVQPLYRIGIGLILASASMAAAALVEVKRRGAAQESVELSVLWLGWQYLLLGVSDMFTLAGMLEFFYTEAPHSMRSVCTALSWCSTAMGYFLSSLMVAVANSASGWLGKHQWLAKENLNESRLELFYTLLAVLNFLNFFNYMYWVKWYRG
ncbi:protein NRT1/ PTR FAMILY 4.1-like [Aristolochia californica]|uniref:protein NRT1/ PTR FAMILY 4.1-like n=1 Tax=Aristolochia californica TaxID=171875 RepID=UPI0035E21A86